jgi:hypothetical protein
MKVTFQANAKVMGYHPGNLYSIDSEDLTDQVYGLLRIGRHLTLIDPLTVEEIDGGRQSHSDTTGNQSSSRSGNGQGTAPKGGTRSTDSKATGPKVGRDEELYRRGGPSDIGGTASREPKDSTDESEREESNSNNG